MTFSHKAPNIFTPCLLNDESGTISPNEAAVLIVAIVFILVGFIAFWRYVVILKQSTLEQDDMEIGETTPLTATTKRKTSGDPEAIPFSIYAIRSL